MKIYDFNGKEVNLLDFAKEQGFNYYAASVPADQEDNYIKVTIYGYKKTIEQASEIAARKDYYAAIQMQSGVLDVQNGGFYSYFGVDRTACVNSQGGTIKIKKGKFITLVITDVAKLIEKKNLAAFASSANF